MDQKTKMLGTERVGKLLIKLSVPAMTGMIVQALYNLVDAVYIGRGVGHLGIAGVAVSFPIQMIVMAVAQMIGMGGASLFSRKLGAKDIEGAEKVLGNVISLVIVASAAVSIFGSIFLKNILQLFGATDLILPFAADYMSIILLSTIFFAFGMATNNMVRAEGNAKVAMFTMLISAILNIILDPIFIFGLNLGIKGAAIATVISQSATSVYLAFFYLGKKSSVRLHLNNLLWDFKILPKIFSVGSASFVRQVAGSLLTAIINNSLVFYGGEMSIAVYGTINRLIMFVFMPMFGIAQGLQPIAGYNYGAGKLKRSRKAVTLAIIFASLFSTGGFIALMSFPGFFISFFSTDVDLISQGSAALRIMVIMFPLVGFQVIGASFFQAIGKALPSLVLSMSRQLLFLIPLLFILPNFFQIQGIWISFPVADLLSIMVTFFMFAGEIKRFKKDEILFSGPEQVYNKP